MPNALDKFKSLEERIALTIAVIKSTRSEKETLERDLSAARMKIVELKEELAGLREERKAVRDRVKGLIVSVVELTEKRNA